MRSIDCILLVIIVLRCDEMRNSGLMRVQLEGKMRLELTIEREYLAVTVLNTSSQELRLWELHNSWGWYSFSVELRHTAAKPVQIIKRKPREWTKNGPTYFVLSPGESQEIQLNIKDGWWDIGRESLNSKNRLIEIRIRLKIDSSPEAEEYGVFVGTALSNWIESIPPHHWLFAETEQI